MKRWHKIAALAGGLLAALAGCVSSAGIQCSRNPATGAITCGGTYVPQQVVPAATGQRG